MDDWADHLPLAVTRRLPLLMSWSRLLLWQRRRRTCTCGNSCVWCWWQEQWHICLLLVSGLSFPRRRFPHTTPTASTIHVSAIHDSITVRNSLDIPKDRYPGVALASRCDGDSLIQLSKAITNEALNTVSSNLL